MKKYSALLVIVLISNFLQAGNFEWQRLIQFSQRGHFATGIATDPQLNVTVAGSYYSCLLCTKVGFIQSVDSLSAPRWSATATTFGVYGVEFSKPYCDNNGNVYSTIYIPQYFLNGPQLSVGFSMIGGPDSTGYVVLFRFSPAGHLDWYRVIGSTKPTVHCAESSGNNFLSNGDSTWKVDANGVQSWINTSKGGNSIAAAGSDVYVGNGTLLERLSAGSGLPKATWSTPGYSDIEASSGGVVFGTGSQGTFKLLNGNVQFLNSNVKGNCISRRGVDMWVMENKPATGGPGGTLFFKRLSTGSGTVFETDSINGAQANGIYDNMAIDVSGSLHLTFSGYDGGSYTYFQMKPFIVWRDYNNYEGLFLAKFRTKYLQPEVGFTNAVWANGEFGVNGWNAADIGAAKPCSGVNGFNVNYTVVNTNLVSGNVVNVELSDSTGDFTNPIVIGTKTTTLRNSSIYCDIPYSLPNGPFYRIRIRTTNPVLTSRQVSNPLGIYAPKSTLSASGPLAFCEGSTGTQLAAISDNSSYTVLWQRNGVIQPELFGDIISPLKSGDYVAQVSDFDGCIRRSENSIAVTVWPLPKATINTSGNILICKDSTLQLKVVSPTAVSYQWLRNNSILSGANDSIFTAGSGGSYKALVTDANACSKTSANVKVSVYASVINTESPLSFCSGDSAVLSGPVTNTISYQWRWNGTDILGANSITYTAKQAGSYRVLSTSTAVCTALSPAKIITINCRTANPGSLSWSVYPNPATDALFVEWGENDALTHVELLDMSGRLMLKVSGAADHQLRLPLDGFSAGFYILRVTGDGGFTESRRIVKY